MSCQRVSVVVSAEAPRVSTNVQLSVRVSKLPDPVCPRWRTHSQDLIRFQVPLTAAQREALKDRTQHTNTHTKHRQCSFLSGMFLQKNVYGGRESGLVPEIWNQKWITTFCLLTLTSVIAADVDKLRHATQRHQGSYCQKYLHFFGHFFLKIGLYEVNCPSAKDIYFLRWDFW